MAPLVLRKHLPYSAEQVWEELRHIDRHVTWMLDAASITFEGDQREGVGTTFHCVTKIGPLRTTDIMTVTQWEEGRRMGVAHRGLVTGEGVFTLTQTGRGTLLEWEEDLTMPWQFLGPVGAFLARPLFRLVWTGNLRRFASQLSHSV